MALTLTLSLVACGGTKGTEAGVVQNAKSGVQAQNLTPAGAAWRDGVLKSPNVAEVENNGVKYQVYVSDSKKYVLNTSTNELTTGTSTGDAKGTSTGGSG